MRSQTSGKGRRSFEAAIADSKADGDVIRLTVTWSGNTIATLTAVRDNGAAVPVVATEGEGRIDITYTSETINAHSVEVDLEFPGKTLKNLALVGHKGDGEDQELDSKDEVKNRWGADGVLS